MEGAFFIIGIFVVVLILTVSIEAAFKNKNEKNLKAGIEKNKKEVSFPLPELEQPKKD